MMKLFFLILSSFFLSAKVLAAACCGGGFAAPSVIVGDAESQFTATYSMTRIADDVDPNGIWSKRSTSENAETLKFEGARIFWDRYQGGLSVPLVRRTRADQSATGLGDVAGTLGYEYLPDWDYNVWRPRGVGFFQLTLPTGRTTYEDEGTAQLDSRGRGFFALGVGAILTKTLGHWDAQSSLNFHRSFARVVHSDQFDGVLRPGFGGEAAFGVGYNGARWRLGTTLVWTSEDAVQVEGTMNSAGGEQKYTTAALSANYMFDEEWASTIVYSDQTSFGNPMNANLGRGVSLLLQRRWMR